MQAIDALATKALSWSGLAAQILKGALGATVQQDFDDRAKQLRIIVEQDLNGSKPDKNWVTIPGQLITPENAK